MSASSGRNLAVKRVAAAVVIAAAIVTFGLSTHHDLETTAGILSHKSVRVAAAGDGQVECIYQAIRKDVPKGAVIYTAKNNRIYYQRIEELSTLWAIPTPTEAQAQYDVFLYKAPGHCDGVALAVRRT